ncbi:hypothetical protein [Deinococcus aquiradiocola]|uniref:Uncharacterized protein n=1 Tax=Deinococcus aquiradiocola TaxID=393059 RepID=A0A917PA83_9DEIO|nr:hypothetical protein [Deinococcus aquiradiocola]GGJ68409.1 hypothetical protein GCM10008939_11040 [Deinococcus aquiradiocola]
MPTSTHPDHSPEPDRERFMSSRWRSVFIMLLLMLSLGAVFGNQHYRNVFFIGMLLTVAVIATLRKKGAGR